MEDAHKRMEEEYYRLSRAINKGINELGSMGSSSVNRGSTPTMAPPTLSRILAEVDMDLAEAEGQVKALEVELRSMSAADKRTYRDKVSQFRNDLNALRRSFGSAKATAEKRILLQQAPGSSKVKGATERLMRSTEQLHDARRVVGETEHIGDGIINQMESQREQLVRASEQVQETSWFTRSARQVMNNMHLRAIRHKACLILIIMFQFILIGIVFNYGVLARYRKKD